MFIPNGDFGLYYMHGGDWSQTPPAGDPQGPGESHSCVVAFPIQVEVALVINSELATPQVHQCALLRDAFDDAWVSN